MADSSPIIFNDITRWGKKILILSEAKGNNRFETIKSLRLWVSAKQVHTPGDRLCHGFRGPELIWSVSEASE
jgi:hypothetical protein